MMRERTAPRTQAVNDAKSDTWTTQDRCMKRRPDKLRRNGRKIDSRVSCTGGFAQAHTHTGSAILPSVTDAPHTREDSIFVGVGGAGGAGEKLNPPHQEAGTASPFASLRRQNVPPFSSLASRLEAATIRPARSMPLSMTGGPRRRGRTPRHTLRTPHRAASQSSDRATKKG